MSLARELRIKLGRLVTCDPIAPPFPPLQAVEGAKCLDEEPALAGGYAT